MCSGVYSHHVAVRSRLAWGEGRPGGGGGLQRRGRLTRTSHGAEPVNENDIMPTSIHWNESRDRLLDNRLD